MVRTFPNVSFAPASPGLRVRMMTLLGFSMVLVVFAAMGIAGWNAGKDDSPWVAWLAMSLAPVISLAVVTLVWAGARIRAFRLVDGELVIDRLFDHPRFSLQGLESVSSDRAAMQGARKKVGNDGLGAVSGRFRSKKLGLFRAYLTNAEDAIVLRWADRAVVVSPDRGYAFVEAVRERSGLKS
jgi:hypothetical protein